MIKEINTVVDLLAQFTGGRGGIDHVVVQFVVTSLFWGCLLALARVHLRRSDSERERFLMIGFALGLGRELLMLGMAVLQALGWVNGDSLHRVFPPLEHALSNLAMVVVAAAFLNYLVDAPRLARRYLVAGCAAISLCYLVTFGWWADFITANPTSKFGQTWCDWLFRIVASLCMLLPLVVLLRRTRGWLRNLICTALFLFFLNEFLKIIDMALGEKYEMYFTPFRHTFYMIAVFLFGLIYIRELFSERDRAEVALKEKQTLLQTILDAIPSPIYYKKHDGKFLGCNSAFTNFIGFPLDKIIASTIFDLTPEENALKFENMDRQIIQEGEPRFYESSIRGANGLKQDVLFHKALFKVPGGEGTGLVGTMLDISERKQAESEIHNLAYFDVLTGLPNRLLFIDRLRQSLAHAMRLNLSLALIFLDLDRFKDINDTLGHEGGDALLCQVAERVNGIMRANDSFARLGGDEFTCTIVSVQSEQEIVVVIEKIQELLAAPFSLGDREVFTSASIGVAVGPQDGSDAHTLLKHADMAMYASKERGRGGFRFYSEEMNKVAIERHELANNLRSALKREELHLVYQPQFDMSQRRITGVEALLRWNHPEMGAIPPERFVLLAEEIGLIRPIGEWVLHQACSQVKRWHDKGYAPLRIGVNISGRQFRQPDLLEMIARVLRSSGLKEESLELELTESILMETAESNVALLKSLKDQGVRLAIDDFGTGYSSLSYLKHFPMDRIKIDQSFVRDITRNSDDAAIVEAVIAMSQRLGMEVLAEGVETRDQMNFLIERECYQIQGYYLGKPMDPDQFSHFLSRQDNISPFLQSASALEIIPGNYSADIMPPCC